MTQSTGASYAKTTNKSSNNARHRPFADYSDEKLIEIYYNLISGLKHGLFEYAIGTLKLELKSREYLVFGENIVKGYVTEEQLINMNWDNVTLPMVFDLNRVLEKYDITSTEQIRHFLAQCAVETGWGKPGDSVLEVGSDEYFLKKDYGKKYRGAGYIHITWGYGYEAFATYLILEKYPVLKSSATYKNPSNNGKDAINTEYQNAVNAAKERTLDVKIYTDIVDKGSQHIADCFAWESAGYYWDVNGVNDIIDNGGLVDDVTRVINRYTDSYKKRNTAYENTLKYIRLLAKLTP
jgi:predicted chitinase